MECKRTRKMISQYIDEVMGPDEKKDFVSHIRDCAACREVLEESRAVHQMFASVERFSAPYGFATRVLANLVEIEEKREARPWGLLGLRSFFPRAAQVAFALAVMIIGIISGDQLLVDRTRSYGQATVQEVFSLDLFQAMPRDSIGGIYLGFMGGKR